MDTREKSARLTIPAAQKIAPWILNGRTKQVRQHWKNRGVPWEVLGPILVAERDGPAHGMHSVGHPPYPSPPEADMRELGDTWVRLVEVVKQRNGAGRREWRLIKAILEDFNSAGAVSGKSRPRAPKKVTRETTR